MLKRSGLCVVLMGVVCCVGCGRREIAEMNDRVAALEARISTLRETIQRQEALLATQAAALDAAALSNRVAEAVSARLNAGLQGELAALVDDRISARIGTEEDIQAVFEDVFSETMDEIEKQEEQRRTEQREERRKQWEEARARREEARAKQLAEDLQLDEQQAEQVKAASARFNESMRQVMTNMRESGEFSLSAVRVNLDELRAGRDAEMREILDDEQYEAYKQRPSTLNFMSNILRGFEQASTPAPAGE